MKPAFVLDASTTLSWCFVDEADPAADAALAALGDASALVPGLWIPEVANVLLLAERRGSISRSGVENFLDDLGRLPIEVAGDCGIETWPRLFALGREYGLTSYDAMYLDLALRNGLPMATCDTALLAAMEKCGVEPFR